MGKAEQGTPGASRVSHAKGPCSVAPQVHCMAFFDLLIVQNSPLSACLGSGISRMCVLGSGEVLLEPLLTPLPSLPVMASFLLFIAKLSYFHILYLHLYPHFIL